MSFAQPSYIAASTNRHPYAADISSSSLIAFGSNRLVALWNPADDEDRGVYATFPGHAGLVTCVRFIGEDRIASADDKGSLRIWLRSQSSQTQEQWVSTYVVQAHKQPIASLAILDRCIVSGASDSTVKVWKLSQVDDNDTLEEVQTIELGGRYPLSIALANLPGSEAAILAVGSTDRKVHIYTRSDDLFMLSLSLSGHEDWIRALSFRTPPSGSEDTLILASGSQDCTIRLWNIAPLTSFPTQNIASGDVLRDELLDEFEAALGDVGEGEEGRQVSLKRHVFAVKEGSGSLKFSITFDALLIGHEAGVTSLSWSPSSSSTSTPTLLSTSTDSSLILWSPSTIITSASASSSSAIWINRQRFGDIGGQRLGGFVGGLWAREGTEAGAWGWSGGWRRWRCKNTSDQSKTVIDVMEEWEEVGAVTGHAGAVKGAAWSPGGEYLISASLDQTTRIHGPIPSASSGSPVWHELARPQVHGYDIVGVQFLDPLRFVSIADEKVVRVFEAPREFVEVVKNLGVAEVAVSADEERPRAATVPPLGLSNKATSEDPQASASDTPYDTGRTSRRPFEGELAAITLWPEVEKVFGHGYESMALAVSPSKAYIATACKATSPEHAVVRVYDTTKWQAFGRPLGGHSLTVTRIAFSPDDKFVLSVSRDRSWCLFEKREDGYHLVAADKSHSRIIWDCAWAHEGDLFATASRDKTVKIWKQKEADANQKWTSIATISLKEAATAVAFAPANPQGRRKLAIGLESGAILIYASQSDSPSEWILDLTIDSRTAHVDHIHQLSWRPRARIDSGVEQLASCSEDGTLKVIDVRTAAGTG